MGSSQRIASGVIWSILLNVIKGIYGFISVPILISHFGKSNYGLIGLAMSVNVYLSLMDLGFNSTNIRFFSNWLAAGKLKKVRKLFQTSLSFYGIIGIINALVLIIISFFSAKIFNLTPEQDEISKHLFYILAISAFISWFTSCFGQLIKAHEYVGWVQKITIIPIFTQLLILWLTIMFQFSITLYYMLTVFSMFIILPLCVYKIRHICSYISFCPQFDRQIFKEIFPYSINIFSFGLFQFSVTYLRPVLLGMQGRIEDVADYRVLNGIIQIVLMLGGAFTGVFLPSASKVVALDDQTAQNKIAYQGTKYISIILCFCCFAVMSVSQELILAYVGPEYIKLTFWLNLWLLTTLAAHNQAISSLILSSANIRAITYSTMITAVIGLSTCWFLIPYYAIGGTIIGYGIYMISQMGFYYIYYWPKVMKLNSVIIFTHCFIPYVFIGITGVIICSYFSISTNKWSALMIKGIIFSSIYIPIVLFSLNKEDKKNFKKLFKQKK